METVRGSGCGIIPTYGWRISATLMEALYLERKRCQGGVQGRNLLDTSAAQGTLASGRVAGMSSASDARSRLPLPYGLPWGLDEYQVQPTYLPPLRVVKPAADARRFKRQGYAPTIASHAHNEK
jgi:hypothetical protein